ncbi:MAG: hypothetical protein RSB98_02875 [Raoultibacter sp.]
MEKKLIIQNGSTAFEPCVLEGIDWTTERKGVPGKLTFEVYQDDILNVQEGNAVKWTVDGKDMFYGYIFRMSRSKDKTVKITAYDQMRYLKNKYTYSYKAKTATDVINMIVNDFEFKAGEIASIAFVIVKRIEENKTLLDMIQTALEITLTNTKKLYVFYDDAGKLTLTPIDDMRVGLLVDAETGQGFEYSSSIDDETYNRIMLVHGKGKKQKTYIAEDKENMKKWGLLQYYESIDEKKNAQLKADSLLALHNVKSKTLQITGCAGDLRVRAGSLIAVTLNLGDTKVNNWMIVEVCKHSWRLDEHTMDLTLRGGEFVG